MQRCYLVKVYIVMERKIGMKELWDLFWTFTKMGAVTFGGGYAMLPILQREVVQKNEWATEEEILDYYAIGQCLPGIIAVNTSIFVGQKHKGILGGIAAALGIVFPSLVIITIIAMFLSNFMDSAILANAFAGIRVCVSVLILNAVLRLRKSSIIDAMTLVLFFTVFAAATFTELSPVIYVVIAAVIGIVVKSITVKKAA